MKTIVLIPVKNESWILRSSLRNCSNFADHIIVADQGSTDGSIDIYKEFPKVTVINNPNDGHSNKVRWLLLDEARKIPGENLILCIDADEMISPRAVKKMLTIASEPRTGKGLSFRLPWIQLWKSTSQHRVDSVWKNNYKEIAFVDNRQTDYNKEVVINDHTARIPATDTVINISEYPLLHFQFVAWKRNQVKQAWYRCAEYVRGLNPRKINLKYSISMDGRGVETIPINPDWLADIQMPDEKDLTDAGYDWHLREIFAWFNTKGTAFFEPLQIWDIPELREMFIKENGRAPKPQTYPKMYVTAGRAVGKISRMIKSLI